MFEAAADGATEGTKLAINIAAMLIAFIAFVAIFNHLLLKLDTSLGLQAASACPRRSACNSSFRGSSPRSRS